MKKEIANWGNYPVMQSDERNFSQLEDIRQFIPNAGPFIPRGNGRCYGDASLAGTTINTTRFDKILSFDTSNGILECQSGITLDQVLEVIVPKGWFLPVTPGTKFITIGGAVASDVHGKNHHVDGCFSHHVEEMDLLLADGALITCGPSLHTDLFEATCGGMGLTGLIIRIRFRLKKVETSYIRQKQVKAANLEEVISLFEKYKDYTYSVAWIDCLTYRDEKDGIASVTVGPGDVLTLQLDEGSAFASRCPEQYAAMIEAAAFVNWRRIEGGLRPILALSFH